eukprot:11271186-Alexandrium_andersonii.AAC.1
MSASLVGSEMCIRDRVRGSHEGAMGSRKDRVAPRVLVEPSLEGERARGCLLYTSDAADDM